MLPVSNDTLLRVVRRRGKPHAVPPTVVGIDDWAWRRNCRYGTIICDLERPRTIARLPDRRLRQWNYRIHLSQKRRALGRLRLAIKPTLRKCRLFQNSPHRCRGEYNVQDSQGITKVCRAPKCTNQNHTTPKKKSFAPHFDLITSTPDSLTVILILQSGAW